MNVPMMTIPVEVRREKDDEVMMMMMAGWRDRRPITISGPD
jgi:hypothetical protein